MPALNIRIITEEEKATTEVFDQSRPDEKAGELTDATIVERTMRSGKAGVFLRVTLPDGTQVSATTSADIIRGLYHAMIGAEARFADLTQKRN